MESHAPLHHRAARTLILTAALALPLALGCGPGTKESTTSETGTGSDSDTSSSGPTATHTATSEGTVSATNTTTDPAPTTSSTSSTTLPTSASSDPSTGSTGSTGSSSDSTGSSSDPSTSGTTSGGFTSTGLQSSSDGMTESESESDSDCGFICPPDGDCDPVAQDCPDNGDGCLWAQDKFVCITLQGDGMAGDACEFVNVCAEGLACVASDFIPGCNALGCCTPFCDLDGPDNCPLPNTECTPWFEQGMAPPGYEHVGVCVLPQ